MADHFGSLVAISFFVLLVCGVLLANALVDLGAGPLREWRSARREGQATAPRPGNGNERLRPATSDDQSAAWVVDRTGARR